MGTEMNVEAERAAFEAWAELTDHQKQGANHEVVGWYYFDEVCQDRWEAWQARAALASRHAGEVELPPLPEGWETRTEFRPGGYCETKDAMEAMQDEIKEWRARAALASRPVADISECTEDMYWAALEVLEQWGLLDEGNCVADKHRGIKAAVNAALASKPAAIDAEPPLSSEPQAEKGDGTCGS